MSVGSGPADGASDPAADGWLTLRQAGEALGARDAGVFTTALALANWHATHRYCPRCGAPTEPTQAGWVRRCERDGSEHYPRTDPAVIMSVVDPDDRLLLGRGAHWPEGRFSVLAGFVEPGESFEAAVAREVAEEVGVTVDEARYLGNQPWPFPSSVMIGFAATTRETELTIDPVEMAEARWVTREEYRDLLRERHDPHPERHLDRQADHRALARPDGRVRAAAGGTCGGSAPRGFVSRRGGSAPPRATGWSRRSRRGRRPSGRCGCRR